MGLGMLARAGGAIGHTSRGLGFPASRSSAPRWNAPTCDVAIRSTIPDLKDRGGGCADKSAAEHMASRGESCSADSGHQLHRNVAKSKGAKATRVETQTCACRSRAGSSSASVIRTGEANTTTTERNVSRKSLRARATSSSCVETLWCSAKLSGRQLCVGPLGKTWVRPLRPLEGERNSKNSHCETPSPAGLMLSFGYRCREYLPS
jgi:hypothetical protein